MESRVVWLDSLKGVLIILVVFAHCLAQIIGNDAANNDYWWCLIYSFHMAAFMAVSGYLQFRPAFSKQKPLGQQLWRRLCQLMIPFFVWSVVYFAIRGHIEQFFNCIKLPNVTFWFLWALFFISVLFALLECLAVLLRMNKEILMGAVCVVCAITLVIFKDIHFLGIQYVLYYYIFYVMGYYIHRFRIVVKNTALLILLAVTWFLLASYWRPHILPEFIPLAGMAATMLRFVYKFVVAAVAVVVMFTAAPKVLNGDNKANWVLVWLGKYSLGIYVIHLTFIDLLQSIVSRFIAPEGAQIWILFIVLTLISSAIIWILTKNKWTGRIFLGKY